MTYVGLVDKWVDEDDADEKDDVDDDDDDALDAVSLDEDDDDEDDEDALDAVSLQFIWLSTCGACVVLGLDVGLLVGLLFQLGTVVVRTQL